MEMLLAAAVFFVALILFLKRRNRKNSINHKASYPVQDAQVPRPRRPKKSASQEEIAKYKEAMRQNAISTFERDKKNAVFVGSKKYIWRTSGDSDVCQICAKNNGRKFSWDKPPEHGHPGYGACSIDGHCRCYAETVIPD